MLINYLRCNYLVNPIGIDDEKPRFSYLLSSRNRGKSQSAYRILVASTRELLANDIGDIWDSKKVIDYSTSQIEYDGNLLKSNMQCYWKVMIWDEGDIPSNWSDEAFWEMGLINKNTWKAEFIGLVEENQHENTLASPLLFCKKINISEEISNARVYATALGIYELKINNTKVGDHILAPEWTNYHKRVQYQTYDVTTLLEKGGNVLSAEISNGWYCGLWQAWPPRAHLYGEHPQLLFQLEIVYKCGRKEIVVSDGSWRVTTEGPLRFAGIYEGETYDARKEFQLLKEIEVNPSKWKYAQTQSKKDIKIVAQRNEPIKITQTLKPIAISEPKPNIFLVDFGQNMVGRINIKFSETRDTLITIRHNEMLNPDGTLYMDNLVAGCFVKNVDRQIIRYICKGNSDCYSPKFTYMGFRYIEISGLSKMPSVEDIIGEVFHTSFKETGTFECSDPDISRLQQNIQWSQRGNMMGIPTDCPQRDERCGYTGDMQFFMPTAVFNMDMAAFMSKWLVDLCQDSQLEGGIYADHAPYFGMSGGNVGWGDAGIICPYLCYKTYGDKIVIRDNYTSMVAYTHYLISTCNDDYTRGPDYIGLGDWLNLGGGASKEVIGTTYLAYVMYMMSEMAMVIGEQEDYLKFKELNDKIRLSFIKKFISAEGSILNSSQTGYALAFTMGLIPQELRTDLTKAFVKEIEKFDYKLVTGFIGTPRLLIALNEIGRDDLAYKLLFQKDCPSWLFPVTVGATTIWERWDGWTKENGFQEKCMNSFNHFAFGAVGDYLFSCIGGIKALDIAYKVVRIKPVIGFDITWANTKYESINGEITTSWKLNGNKYFLKVNVPVNIMARVYIRCTNINSIYESGILATNSYGVAFCGMEDNHCVFECISGEYAFETIIT